MPAAVLSALHTSQWVMTVVMKLISEAETGIKKKGNMQDCN